MYKNHFSIHHLVMDCNVLVKPNLAQGTQWFGCEEINIHLNAGLLTEPFILFFFSKMMKMDNDVIQSERHTQLWE